MTKDLTRSYLVLSLTCLLCAALNEAHATDCALVIERAVAGNIVRVGNPSTIPNGKPTCLPLTDVVGPANTVILRTGLVIAPASIYFFEPGAAATFSDLVDLTVPAGPPARIEIAFISNANENVTAVAPLPHLLENGSLQDITGFLFSAFPIGTEPFIVKFSSDLDAGPVGPSGGSAGKVKYEAPSSRLSFPDDVIVDTGTIADPILGARVFSPQFTLDKVINNGAQILFRAVGDDTFTYQKGTDVFLLAHMPTLTYDLQTNLFSGTLSGVSLAGEVSGSPLFNPSLANITSEFIDQLDSLLDPNSPLYDPLAAMTITFAPESNFFADTNGFTASAVRLITDGSGIGRISEPSTLLLLAIGIIGFFAPAGRRRLVGRAIPSTEPAR